MNTFVYRKFTWTICPALCSSSPYGGGEGVRVLAASSGGWVRHSWRVCLPSVSSLLSGSGSYSILCDKSVSAPIADFVFYHWPKQVKHFKKKKRIRWVLVKIMGPWRLTVWVWLPAVPTACSLTLDKLFKLYVPQLPHDDNDNAYLIWFVWMIIHAKCLYQLLTHDEGSIFVFIY